MIKYRFETGAFIYLYKGLYYPTAQAVYIAARKK